MNFGVDLDWFPGARAVGIRLEAQHRNFDDVVTTSVTGLPKNDNGFTFGVGVVFTVYGASRRLP